MGLLIQAKNDWLPFFVCFPLLYCQFKPSNAAIVVWFLLSFPGSKSVLFSPNNNVQIGWFIIWFWWNEVEIWALWGGTRCCWNAFWIELAEKRMHFKSTECQNGFYHANKCHFTIKLFQNTAHSWRLRTSTLKKCSNDANAFTVNDKVAYSSVKLIDLVKCSFDNACTT